MFRKQDVVYTVIRYEKEDGRLASTVVYGFVDYEDAVRRFPDAHVVVCEFH